MGCEQQAMIEAAGPTFLYAPATPGPQFVWRQDLAETYDLLIYNGVEIAQGYYLGSPYKTGGFAYYKGAFVLYSGANYFKIGRHAV
jgi:hypothetical protein